MPKKVRIPPYQYVPHPDPVIERLRYAGYGSKGFLPTDLLTAAELDRDLAAREAQRERLSRLASGLVREIDLKHASWLQQLLGDEVAIRELRILLAER